MNDEEDIPKESIHFGTPTLEESVAYLKDMQSKLKVGNSSEKVILETQSDDELVRNVNWESPSDDEDLSESFKEVLADAINKKSETSLSVNNNSQRLRDLLEGTEVLSFLDGVFSSNRNENLNLNKVLSDDLLEDSEVKKFMEECLGNTCDSILPSSDTAMSCEINQPSSDTQTSSASAKVLPSRSYQDSTQPASRNLANDNLASMTEAVKSFNEATSFCDMASIENSEFALNPRDSSALEQLTDERMNETIEEASTSVREKSKEN